jgi:hypothetical protein
MSSHFDWDQFFEEQEVGARQSLTSFDPFGLERISRPDQHIQELTVVSNELNTGDVQNLLLDLSVLPAEQSALNDPVIADNAVSYGVDSLTAPCDAQANPEDAQVFNPKISLEDWHIFNDMAGHSEIQSTQSTQLLPLPNTNIGDFSELFKYSTEASVLPSETTFEQMERPQLTNSSVVHGLLLSAERVPAADSNMSQLSVQCEPCAYSSSTDGKPKRDGGRREARINATTQGGTSRTSKINNYEPTKSYPVIYPHPFSKLWYTANNKTFAYNQYNELEESTFSFNRLYEFIRQHPSRRLNNTTNAKLTLFVQKGPADSTRRYPTTQSDKCRFADCPSRKYGFHGTIAVGHFRVALDELSQTYGEATDPFLCAGYVHLYCLERFVNFLEVCRMPHVQVIADNRTLRKEPNATFRAKLEGNVYALAATFIDACSDGSLEEKFPQYPEHVVRKDQSGKRFVEPKDHTKTLNYALQKTIMPDRSKTAKNIAKSGTLAATFGDLEVQLGARRYQYIAGRKARKSVKRTRDESEDEDENEYEVEDEDEHTEKSDDDEWKPSPKRTKRAKR